jgi:hypothetical protein
MIWTRERWSKKRDGQDDDLPLQWVAEPGEEIEVLTADFCDHFGGCADCPGIATPKESGLDSDSEHTTFCTHWCHQVSTEA